jgi:hypothetical protein
MKIFIKKMGCDLLMFAILAACSGGEKRPNGLSRMTAESRTDNAASEQKTADSDSAVLELLPNPGSTTRFLDARGLTEYYKNVFVPKAFGFMHCQNSKPQDMLDCTDSIFDHRERRSMGAFDLGAPRHFRALQNVNPPVNLTLNYMRTLRKALSRECIALVDAELVKYGAKDVAGNFLIKGDKPTVGDLNDFMKRLLGLDGTSITVPIDAEAYVAAYENSLATNKDKNVGMRNAYVGICIALTMDPLVFIY